MREVARRRLRGLLLAAVAFHLVFSFARLPQKAWAKRLHLIGEWRDRGPIGYHIGRSWPEAAHLLGWIRDTTPRDAVVLYRGHWKGVLEFAPALLHPRLLCAEAAVPAGATDLRGRPLARGRLPAGEEGVLVLVAEGTRLSLGVR